MITFSKLEKCLIFSLRIFCPPVYIAITSEYHEKRCLKRFLGFIAGFGLGQYYYKFFLKDILHDAGFIIGWIISLILGVGNVISTQVRCISLLLFPTYCGKPGRGVLKAIVLSYVVIGPITNMGMNAREVVRVFACSTQLSNNLAITKYAHMYRPINKALLSLQKEVEGIKDTISSVHDVISPIKVEIEGTAYLQQMKAENELADALLDSIYQSRSDPKGITVSREINESDKYQQNYLQKMNIRCENQLYHAVKLCMSAFSSAYDVCNDVLPSYAAMICWSLMLPRVCDIKAHVGADICDIQKQINPGLSKGYAAVKVVYRALTSNLSLVKLQHKITYQRELRYIQDAKETGDRVVKAVQEKYIILNYVTATVNICLALLFLRVAVASHSYHDLYLTSIDYDNVYITAYFKRIDLNRGKKNKITLLPLKKMERNRYIDVLSTSYIASERKKLLTQILKVMLEAVTATTFVMLDRLFFEALDVVRQHALETTLVSGMQDVEVEVEGEGLLSRMIRAVLGELKSSRNFEMVSNEMCVPQPRQMPIIFYIKIYGGYMWILLLLYINPYTLRLRRLICSYFYPVREKQRILHLYNDILKKRMKMQKTLRRKAVQSVRAHYLSGENLLSLRIRFPQLLGWLRALPVARMKCLICEETEPRNCSHERSPTMNDAWYSCIKARCPFIYCKECWQEVGSRCLACDPALAELSDIDSLSDDNPPRY